MTDPDRGESARLRALLEDAVADVQPAPALDRIRARTTVTPIRRRPRWILAAAGAVAATAATVTVVTLTSNTQAPQTDPGQGPAATGQGPVDAGPDDPSPGTPPDGSPGTSPSPPSSEEPSTSGEGEPAAGAAALPIYFVGNTPAGPRLFREFMDLDVDAGWSPRLLAALEQATLGNAADADYGSDWESTGARVVTADLDEATGRLVLGLVGSALSEPPTRITPDAARLAVQQLVYTAQAVVQERAPVVFTDSDGEPLDRLLGVDVSPEVTAAPPLEVLAPVWITSPQEGTQVGTTFTVEGRGAFFEANVSWQLLDGDEVVADGFATARECCTLSPYSFEVTAEPGDYVIRVYAADVSGGEGPGEQEDTKAIMVR